MRRLVASTSLGISLALTACPAFALPGTFAIDQVFSSADGTVQFIEVFDNGRNDCDANEQLWMGLTLKSTGPSGARTYVFPANLPNCRTSQRHILIATEGFAALGLVTPDFTIPNGFLSLAEGSVELANVSQVSYAALPTDGVTALDGTEKPMANVATNLAGASASLAIAPVATVVEYYNAALDHYFISWIAAEIAILDEGVKIKGWSRTGATFRTFTAAQPATSPVCRFYIPPALGDSHFFGRGTLECESTAIKFPGLVLEDPAFMHLSLPQQGACRPGPSTSTACSATAQTPTTATRPIPPCATR